MESSVSSKTNHASKTSWKEVEKEEVSQKTLERIKEIISTLSEGNNFFHPLRLYKGYWCSTSPPFLQGAIFAQEHFRAKPEDIFLCSAPKTGTTWLKALSFATVTRTHFDNSENSLLSKGPHDCVPFLEKDFITNYTIARKPNLPLLATHVPYSWLPKSVIDFGCKIVYVCRDPKDVFVSLWHFSNKVVMEKKCRELPLEEAFELFCKGTSIYGPYWDHVLGYWKVSLEFPDRILFLKYEEMMKNPVFHLKRLAEFMGYPFSLEEEIEGVVQRIVDLCSFENLSNLEVNKTGIYDFDEHTVNNNVFFRKAKIGDWKDYLTSEMRERVNKIVEAKLGGSGLKLF